MEGQDPSAPEDVVYMRTTRGPLTRGCRVPSDRRRFPGPLLFRPDSSLGVPGLLTVYRAGNVTIANAIGTGVVDDKSIYPYVPEMVRFYLSEERLLGNVRTWILGDPADRATSARSSARAGGEGGPRRGRLWHADRTGSDSRAARGISRADQRPPGALHRPADARPSTSPTFANSGSPAPHRSQTVRPFGRSISVVPGGLTRVALREGSLIVNGSQGGGTKDTWVLER